MQRSNQRSNHSLEKAFQWQVYRQLEALPETITNPSANVPEFQLGLDVIWRSFVSVLVDELTDPELQAAYLERCWQTKADDQSQAAPARKIQQIWTLLQ